ncbi:50S ribosomal protein L24 [Patescibacteria group bacterium]
MKKFKKGDTVYIAKGKDRGKTGKILKVFGEAKRIIVDGINIKKRHIRPKRTGQKGQVVEVPGKMIWSNVRIVCPQCKKSTRIGFVSESDEKKRVCKKCKTAF